METYLKRIGTGLKTICRCSSVAMQQARQSEIDVLSRRRFRERNGPGDSSLTHPRDAGLGTNELVARLGIGLRTFQNCCSEAKRKAEQGEIDTTARRLYQETQGAAQKGMEESGSVPRKGIASKDLPGEIHAELIERSLEKVG